MSTSFDSVTDSGARRDFGTGSVRDQAEGKGRYDLLEPVAIKRLAQHFENGAKKYGDHNWKLGQPLSVYLDSGIRHGFNLLEGKTDEDHAAAMAWNAMAFISTKHWIDEGTLPAELDDIDWDGDEVDRLVEIRRIVEAELEFYVGQVLEDHDQWRALPVGTVVVWTGGGEEFFGNTATKTDADCWVDKLGEPQPSREFLPTWQIESLPIVEEPKYAVGECVSVRDILKAVDGVEIVDRFGVPAMTWTDTGVISMTNILDALEDAGFQVTKA